MSCQNIYVLVIFMYYRRPLFYEVFISVILRLRIDWLLSFLGVLRLLYLQFLVFDRTWMMFLLGVHVLVIREAIHVVATPRWVNPERTQESFAEKSWSQNLAWVAGEKSYDRNNKFDLLFLNKIRFKTKITVYLISWLRLTFFLVREHSKTVSFKTWL